jgi:hypothetical protein
MLDRAVQDLVAEGRRRGFNPDPERQKKAIC